MILVLHQGAIGDFLLTLSVVQSVRSWVGNSTRVVAIASAASARWAAGRSAIDTCLSPEDVGLHTLFSERGPLDDRLAAWVNRSAWVLNFLSGLGEPIYERLSQATLGRVISVDPRPSAQTLAERTHISSQWAAAIRAAGLPIPDPEPVVVDTLRLPGVRTDAPAPQASCDWPWVMRDVIAHARRIIIHPGSGGRHKCWPIAHFIALAESLRDQEKEIAWMLGPAECEPGDRRFAGLLERAQSRHEALVIEHDLAEAARRIGECDVYIGNDGGMAHVAAAIGIPTVVIFTATDPRVWRPLGSHVWGIAAGPTRPRSDPL